MQSTDTKAQYHAVMAKARSLFEKKTADYGAAWRILRLPSLTDQIYIKAARIRSIQEKGQQKVADDITGEFIGIINYCIMALIIAHEGETTQSEQSLTELMALYDAQAQATWDLLSAKNHDYGEAWRAMRVSSMTDIILMKLLRIKQIEDNAGRTLVSEGVEANYMDILNYSVFSLVLMEQSH